MTLALVQNRFGEQHKRLTQTSQSHALQDVPAQEPYTLLNDSGLGSGGAASCMRLIDGVGRCVHTWPSTGVGQKALPNGQILGGTIASNNATRVTTLLAVPEIGQFDYKDDPKDTSAAVVWADCGDPTGAQAHHDWQLSSAGVYPDAPGPGGVERLLVLANAYPPASSTAAIRPEAVVDDIFYEVGADGTLLWNWRARDHVEQFGFTPDMREALRVAPHQKQMKDFVAMMPAFATLAPPSGLPMFAAPKPTANPIDTASIWWININAAAYVGPNPHCPSFNDPRADRRFAPNNIIFCARHSSFIGIVARDDHPDGRWLSGDVVWRLGPDSTYVKAESDHPEGRWSRGDALCRLGPNNTDLADGPIVGPHHAHIIPGDLPGAGNVLVMDNGGVAGYGKVCGEYTLRLNHRDFSRVLEIDPVGNRVVWSYQQRQRRGDIPRFYGFLQGSAQRLPTGNTLICEGVTGRVFEVTRPGEVTWQYFAPFGDAPLGGNFPEGRFGNAIYRAYRVSEAWVEAAKRTQSKPVVRASRVKQLLQPGAA